MKVDTSKLLNSKTKATRLLFEVELKPVQGARFQPTGFPDLGAATYETSDGTRLLVESAQSMANRLEAVCFDAGTYALHEELMGISYVRVEDDKGGLRTTSQREAHRLNSPYVLHGVCKGKSESLLQVLTREFEGQSSRSVLAKTLFKYDIGSLLHGSFLVNVDSLLRMERVLSAFIEAEGIHVAASGGFKGDVVNPGTKASDDGRGDVIYQRDEYTAKRIVAYFNVDLEQIRGFGLEESQQNLLLLLALYKIRKLLDGRMRFRTACDLELVSDEVVARRPKEFVLPSLADLTADLPAAIAACASMFEGKNGVTTVEFTA